jgi:hypothetical protein
MATVSPLACGPNQPSTAPAASTAVSTPVTSEPATPEPEPEPEPETSDSCQVLLIVEAVGAKGRLTGPVTLRASAKNLTDAPLELALTDACPDGEARFFGLEPTKDERYDYYNSCAAGMCAGGRPSKVIALPPGETVEISSAQIQPAGDQPCNEPIAPGKYELSFAVVLAKGSSNPVLCGPEPITLHRES